jgi:hypothetical protein
MDPERRRGSLVSVAMAFTVGCLLVGCAGPTVRDSAIHSQAQKSADAMVSQLRTVLLATRGVLDDKMWWRFADRVVSDSEEAATTVEATFSSRQPPSDSSKPVYERVSKQLADAADLVTSMRVAVRMHDAAEVKSLEPKLASTADDLERLSKQVAP